MQKPNAAAAVSPGLAFFAVLIYNQILGPSSGFRVAGFFDQRVGKLGTGRNSGVGQDW
ncbi:hypothetical protein [Castellaniella hirudinis]|uniref:hypothetical protein n=1 Tax=Castellaniella hirudinis TaxID=1144617 RepID=UPI0039C42FB3